jgi:glycosyltransferase involved in cell wall biosynthesis
MKKILFVNDEMRMGGVARILNTLLKNLDQNKYDISLLVLHPHGELMSEIPQGVKVLNSDAFFSVVDERLSDLIKQKKIGLIFQKILLLCYMKTGFIKNKIKKIRQKLGITGYDIEMAAKEGFCTIFTAYGDSQRKINWILTDYKLHNYAGHHMSLMRDALALMDVNIANSKAAKDSFAQVFGVQDIAVVHSLMDDQGIKVKQAQKIEMEVKPGINLICVARFDEQKGIDRLISASIKAWQEGLDHTLWLVGDGPLNTELKAQAKGYDHIIFTGILSNPYPLLKGCDCLVLPSLYEGFATIVSESLICGVPVLATNVAGIHEQITDENKGWICDNSLEALCTKLSELLNKPTEFGKKKQKLLHYRYPNNEILKQMDRLLSGENQ